MLDGLARRRHAIFGASIGLREDLLRLRGRVIAADTALLGQETVGSTLHALGVGFIGHGS